jgi:hypothetical protein
MGLVMLRAGMKRTVRRRAAALAACAIAACAFLWCGDAHAQDATRSADLSHVLELINQQESRLNAQEQQLSEQQRQLGEQRALIERQRAEILAMGGGVSDSALSDMRGAGLPNNGVSYVPLDRDEPISLNRNHGSRPRLLQADASGSAPAPTAVSSTPPDQPVGEAPPEPSHEANAAALPEGNTALLGSGRLVIEPAFDYVRTSSNRLVFRGVEIVTGIQIGLIEANDTARDTLVGTLTARYAVTNRLELEGRLPYVYRHDRITTLSQNEDTTTQTLSLEGRDIGDVEFSARYQLNSGRNGSPIWVAGARIKSDTGQGPFDVARDEQGVSTELATGSGFWGVQGMVSMLYPSDPVVLYANASYLYNIPKDIDQTIGNVTIGEVDPGDSIGFGFGFGFALNQRFSFSLGYSHSYVMASETEMNGSMQQSTDLQVGSMQLGLSFRATERVTLAYGIDVGVTEDAPDLRLTLRTPMSF